MAKKVTFGVKPVEKQSASLDSWVATRSPEADQGLTPETVDSSGNIPAQKEKLKRLTLDIPDHLHRAIKGKAALEGKAMVDMLRELLEEKYGNP
jgi:hypothetical protein